MYDVIILGKGPAGLSAALYTVRAGLKTLIVANGYGAAATTEKIDNYFGFEGTVSGRELIEKTEKHATTLGAELINAEITNIEMDYENGSFSITTANNEKFTSLSVLLATGKNRALPNIKGLKAFDGKGVSRCAVCDGFFYRNKTVAVLGDGDFALAEAAELLPIAASVTIYTNGKELNSERIQINNRKITLAYGDKKIQGFEFDNGEKAEFDGLFVAAGTAGGTEFGAKLGLMMRDGAVICEKDGKTNIPGFFAAGDCTGAPYQISVSVGQGALAGMAITAFIREKNK